MVTRWEAWFADENLARDERILAAPPSTSASLAAHVFGARGVRQVIDLACGIGRDSGTLAESGLHVIGVDASLNGLRVAQQRAQAGGTCRSLVVADARRLPFRDRAAEAIYCFGLLHEFVGGSAETDVAAAVGEMRRLLPERGMLVLTVLSGDPEKGLPHVQMFSQAMVRDATKGLRAIEVCEFDDVGCTGRPDYHIWYGVFERSA